MFPLDVCPLHQSALFRARLSVPPFLFTVIYRPDCIPCTSTAHTSIYPSHIFDVSMGTYVFSTYTPSNTYQHISISNEYPSFTYDVLTSPPPPAHLQTHRYTPIDAHYRASRDSSPLVCILAPSQTHVPRAHPFPTTLASSCTSPSPFQTPSPLPSLNPFPRPSCASSSPERWRLHAHPLAISMVSSCKSSSPLHAPIPIIEGCVFIVAVKASSDWVEGACEVWVQGA